ncbi:MliC family protein [Aidingimonas lacisalsi]|uniref:MliC family protein n=1 Tax=Aidingimonas lacisalsi TaxID=2604086 RepID=UPI0011D21719|nr:MliC family protein [Aidingimonas lacisalsi]
MLPLPSSSSCRTLLLALTTSLMVAGCATSREEPSSSSDVGVRDLEPSTSEEQAEPSVTPQAPLLPSAFFPGDADEFVAWHCTPAQDLVSAFPTNELRLWSGQGMYRLEPAVVASGARYAKEDLSFWNKGEEAIVESDNGRLDCETSMSRDVLTREDRPGVMFHGRGNEPGWTVRLAHDVPEVSMVLDYGERELTLPYRIESLDNEEGHVHLSSGVKDQPFDLSLQARACFDDMSGQPFPVRVILKIDDRTYRGCGQGIAP